MDRQMSQLLWQQTPDAVIATAEDGSIAYWNAAAERTFGHRAVDVVGRPLSDLLIPAAATGARDSPVYETIMRRADGTLLHANVATREIQEATCEKKLTLHIARDVTSLKVQRDAQLVDSRFGTLLESTPDAILIVNSVGRIVLANTQAERVFAYERGQLLGSPVELLLPARFRVTHGSHRADFFSQPRTRAMGRGLELFGLKSTGEEFPVEISLSPLETDAGVMVMSAVRDISERRKAEQKFRALLESAPDAMVIVGADGYIALVNSQTERLFGYSRTELLGRPVEMLVPERYRARHAGHRHIFFQQPRTRSMGAGLELHGVRRDGTEFPVEISLSPLDTEEGLFVSSAIRDATERRRFELRLQETSRLKSEFLANMSHELRTPLNGIIGFSEFLIDEKPGPLNAKQKEYLGDVLASGQHLLHLINDVLDLSKVESGRMELQNDTFPVSLVIDEVCAVVMPLARKKHIELRRRSGPSVVAPVTLDRQKFVQILYNLISNAIKFTDAGGEVRIEAGTPEPSVLQVQVHDTGIGIRPEDIPRLFVEFQQLDSSHARHYGGTGLGLALTRRLIEFQGGRIDVRSEPGRGSTFTVTLPLHDRTTVPTQGTNG